MKTTISRCRILIGILLIIMISVPLYAKDDKINPKEPGVYIKTNKALKRLLPNIIFNEQNLIFIESNNPPHFFLRDLQHFVVYGKYDLSVLTLNPMLFTGPSPLGKGRFIFGKNETIETKKIGTDLYTVKPKGLLGRGYYSLWINDSAWDLFLD
ncbi:MAG: hypothetical protein C0399_07570 [Syntrophus sp. (in: bacteria)]|nr:hypothetical protein [Syntrophus sp. (in: bacteria)]